jgi:hypothetical protein
LFQVGNVSSIQLLQYRHLRRGEPFVQRCLFGPALYSRFGLGATGYGRSGEETDQPSTRNQGRKKGYLSHAQS